MNETLPVIALVGRPNVGKSTLFNCLTKTRQALVADYPGLTRDRQYGQAHYQSHPFWVVDTGGIGVEDAFIDNLMSKQSHQALTEASLVFLLVDARSGRTPIDEDIAVRLHKLNKPVFLVVNKVDGMDEQQAVSEFSRLGFKNTFLISASHQRGVAPLMEAAIKHFSMDAVTQQTPVDTASESIVISFVGRPNVGKSTLMNRILGEERVVVSDVPGTTRDSIMVPFTRGDTAYQLVDTAGVRRRARVDETVEKFSVIKTLHAIESSHVCLMLIDAHEGLVEQDLHLLGLILEAGKALIIVVNKWDGLDDSQKLTIKNQLSRKLQFAQFARVRFISALHGTGVGHLFEDINEAYEAAGKSVSTALITRLLRAMVTQHPPPLVKGRRAKLRYAHVGGHHPLVIVIHGNQLDQLPESYLKYLTNQYRLQLNLVGQPIKLEYRNTDNPFKERKNKLTDRQIKRKRRLMKFVKRQS